MASKYIPSILKKNKEKENFNFEGIHQIIADWGLGTNKVDICQVKHKIPH
jgi:hypothetical protein